MNKILEEIATNVYKYYEENDESAKELERIERLLSDNESRTSNILKSIEAGLDYNLCKNRLDELKIEKEELEKLGAPKVVIGDLAREDRYESVENAFRYSKLVLATTTYNMDIFPYMRDFIIDLAERGYQNRTIALMENGTWAPNAVKIMRGMLEKCQNITYTAAGVKILSALNEESRAQLRALAEELK